MRPLAIFLALQVMDFATTMMAVALGGAEQNPLIAHFMATGPIAGLILSKLIVIAMAGLCVWGRRIKTIRFANIAFALIVIWNLTIIGRLAFVA